MECVDADGNVVGHGHVRHLLPDARVGIGLALLDDEYKPGTEVGVVVRRNVEPFGVEKPPLVQPQVRSA